MSLLRFGYSLLMMLALPLIVLRLAWRARREPRYAHHIGERFGRAPDGPSHESGAIWIHAVSVGEMRAAQPLVDALRRAHPSATFLLTCMTPAGRETARTLYGEWAQVAFLPYDVPWLLSPFLRRFRPRVLLVMETEIWPNLFAACRSRGIPAYLVNARLSARSRDGYARLAPVRALVREALAGLAGVAAQHDDDASHLRQLGATAPIVTGNLKFDVAVDAAAVARGLAWRDTLVPARTVFLWVSTRDGEERALAEAFVAAFDTAARERWLLVVVPRHPQRFGVVADLLTEAGLRVVRRSSGDLPDSRCDTWLGDSMGEVAAYVAMCDFAFVGGSLLPLGGQNFIEVCAQGKPVLMGPSTFNFAEAARAAKAAGALVESADADAVMRRARDWGNDPALRAPHAEAASAFARAHRGATEKTLALIAPALKAEPATS